MMTQPIRTVNNLSSETSPAGGNDIAKSSLPLSFEERRLLDLRARYARAEVLANALGDMILSLRRTFGRLTAAIKENYKLRAAETQLNRMTDRELADLGLCRADIAFAVRETQGFRPQFDVADPVTTANQDWRRAA
ncbi:MAG: DUF1127 domain-containing protein [Reyranella sp.]|uniref:DUF1127 domain-containing protein n=1 Tax=Reyranella sp. TaxID=1929291 RepID=UPI003D135707